MSDHRHTDYEEAIERLVELYDQLLKALTALVDRIEGKGVA